MPPGLRRLYPALAAAAATSLLASPASADHGTRGPAPGESEETQRAIETCVAEIAGNGERVLTVDAARRERRGWRVSGKLERDATYSCRLGSDGAIRDARVEGPGRSYGYGTAPAVRVDQAPDPQDR